MSARRFPAARNWCHGLASGVTVFSGLQVVESAGIASSTIISGGSEIVSAHGTDHGAQISGGTQLVTGLASGVTVFSGGSQAVESGGVVSGTTVSTGGTEIVSAHGTSIDGTVASGATEVVYGLDIGATVTGGNEQQWVSSGGIVSGASVTFGAENVFSGGKTVAVSSIGQPRDGLIRRYCQFQHHQFRRQPGGPVRSHRELALRPSPMAATT